ncbi:MULTISPECIES: hypothetical protein [unclassified Microcoleus]|uniref:hypothetical protein n=1 Tax=unclassified Microcoleus TaxID=2642155 RepID=UPI0025F291E3|nr:MULTISPECIES: hypothetical protein [unclassified Microcoleus]
MWKSSNVEKRVKFRPILCRPKPVSSHPKPQKSYTKRYKFVNIVASLSSAASGVNLLK